MPLVRPPFTPGTWRGVLSKIVWGVADANTILIALPLLEVNTYSVPREGQEVSDGRDGGMDGWRTGWDQRMDFVVAVIPATTETIDGTSATGWWTLPNGWDALLRTWAWDLYPFKLYPNVALGTFFSCYCVAPRRDAPDTGFNFAYRPRFTVATTDGTPFSGW